MQLSRAIHDFVLHMRMEGKAPGTIDNYESDLMLLLGLAGVHGGNTVLAFTPALVRDYFLTLSRRNLKMSTLHRRRASISEFAKYGLRRRLWAIDPMAEAPKIKRPKTLPRPYTHQEHARLMALELPTTERVLMALIYYAGLRISEALSLTHRDAILGDDDHPASLRVRGKGNKERVIPMFPELRSLLYDFFLARPSESIKAFVIAHEDGRPWRPRSAARRAKAWGKAATVVTCTLHRFRHTCGTHLHERGWDIRDIQVFLGHVDINSTVIYTQVSPRHLHDTARSLPLETGRVFSQGFIPPPGGAL